MCWALFGGFVWVDKDHPNVLKKTTRLHTIFIYIYETIFNNMYKNLYWKSSALGMPHAPCRVYAN